MLYWTKSVPVVGIGVNGINRGLSPIKKSSLRKVRLCMIQDVSLHQPFVSQGLFAPKYWKNELLSAMWSKNLVHLGKYKAISNLKAFIKYVQNSNLFLSYNFLISSLFLPCEMRYWNLCRTLLCGEFFWSGARPRQPSTHPHNQAGLFCIGVLVGWDYVRLDGTSI